MWKTWTLPAVELSVDGSGADALDLVLDAGFPGVAVLIAFESKI